MSDAERGDGGGSRSFNADVSGGNSGQITLGDHNIVVQGDHVTVTKGIAAEPPLHLRDRPIGRPVPPVAAGEVLGRDDVLAELGELVDARTTVQLVGPPGIGRTVLLERLATRCAEADSPVVFLDGAGIEPEDLPQKVFESCYDVRDYRPAPERLRRLMESVQVLVIVDDFTGSAADLRALESMLPSGALVVSSTGRSSWSRGRTVRLTGLPSGPARELMERALGRPLTETERGAAEEFRQVVDGHPLALLQAATAVGDAGRDVPGDPERLARALADGLGPADHAVLGALCCLEGLDVPPAIVEALSGTAPLTDVVDRLRRARLVAEGPRGLRALAPAARLVVGSLDTSRRGFDAERAATALADRAAGASAAEVGSLAAVALRVLDAAAADGAHSAAVRLARTVAPALCRTLRWGAWRRVLALGRTAAQEAGSADDARYFERSDETRKRALALALGTGLGVIGGGSFLIGRGLAAKKSLGAKAGVKTGAGAKGCLLSPVVLGTAVAVTIATIMGYLGYRSVGPSDQVSGAEHTQAVETPTYRPPVASSPAPTRTRPQSPGPSTPPLGPLPPTRSQKPTPGPTSSRPGPRPSASRTQTAPHVPPSPSKPPRSDPPPSQSALPSVGGFWRKGAYQVEFPLRDDGTWRNIVLTRVEEDSNWTWLYDCWQDGWIPSTSPRRVEMVCDINHGEPLGEGRVVHNPDNTVSLVVDGRPDVSGTYVRVVTVTAGTL
ncbi:hypothetical protein [Streptomyces sp. T028]|uniref:hypothetical protein n=1 Tax=Streptomyces sp. T028 TaxID=3394379 RepID=UPI003A881580